MPCYHPLQASFSVRADGKKDIRFSVANAKLFYKGAKLPSSNLSIPCGRCMGCRLERSRQWALRCMNEASLYEDNCFVTLTFSDDFLPVDGSLSRKVIQDFLKRLRQKFSQKLRVFYCGEYGDKLKRPHYHLVLFNLDFPDKVYWKSVNGCNYYVSDILSSLWKFGFSTIGDCTFESCAYVACYCTKKVNGSEAEAHYEGRLPEFAQPSLKPGIGRGWFDKFGFSDVYPLDECVVRGVKCKPPRYYDRLLEQRDPDMFVKVKSRRDERRDLKSDDNSHRRLLVKERCQAARVKLLVRSMERL